MILAEIASAERIQEKVPVASGCLRSSERMWVWSVMTLSGDSSDLSWSDFWGATHGGLRLAQAGAAPRTVTSAGAGCAGARDRVRTGDPELGKLVLYQLSYSRVQTGA